jgi:uncharacterized protein (DUF608 family)
MIAPVPDLRALGPQRTYPADASQTAFPLGGIGTGNISLGARGELRDWEIFNHQGVGTQLPYAFFAIRTQRGDDPPVARVLEAQRRPPFGRSHGYFPGDVAGLPRLDDSELSVAYPFATVRFMDRTLPVRVEMEAFTPFIPLDADDSGIPVAVLRYRVHNPTNATLNVSILGSMPNPVGFAGHTLLFDMDLRGTPRNEEHRSPGSCGIVCRNPGLDEDDLVAGSFALLVRDDTASVKPEWLGGYWWDGIQDLWDDFRLDGRVGPAAPPPPLEGAFPVQSALRVGSVASQAELGPGEERVTEFLIAWYFPNRPRAWMGHILDDANRDQRIRNHYAMRFRDALDVADHVVREMPRLEGRSRAFAAAFHETTLPPSVLDAAIQGITVLRSTTCFRIEDGTLLGWEGGFDQRGACEGSCTHVWDYAQTIAYLFPQLERSMRAVEFLLETDADGRMSFRTNRVFGAPRWEMLPAADGQLGTIVRLYREWLLSGDDDFLRRMWPAAARAMGYALRAWDQDDDGLLEAERHNTYDIEFHGPDPLTNSVLLAALAAASRMARALGDDPAADHYADQLARSSARMDAILWNGEYYQQAITDVDAHRYQFGSGCLADQLFGQCLAHLVGLGHVLPVEHVRSAMAAVFRHDFRSSLAEHENVQRTFALGDEAGLVLCSWPRGGRPRLPFVYSDEVWSGVEYQVATHLVYEGLIDEALTVVRAVRDRHDGYRRNPWDEVEFGHHYARSMASWGVFVALSGFRCDLPARRIGFAPAIHAADFRTFWSCGTGWGSYRQQVDPDTGERHWSIELVEGTLDAITVNE